MTDHSTPFNNDQIQREEKAYADGWREAMEHVREFATPDEPVPDASTDDKDIGPDCRQGAHGRCHETYMGYQLCKCGCHGILAADDVTDGAPEGDAVQTTRLPDEGASQKGKSKRLPSGRVVHGPPPTISTGPPAPPDVYPRTDADPGYVVCPSCKGDGNGPPAGADGCGLCAGEGQIKYDGFGSSRPLSSDTASASPLDYPPDTWLHVGFDGSIERHTPVCPRCDWKAVKGVPSAGTTADTYERAWLKARRGLRNVVKLARQGNDIYAEAQRALEASDVADSAGFEGVQE